MKRDDRRFGFASCAAAYILATIVAIICARKFDSSHPIVVAFVADAVGTVVIFAFSRALDNSSVYDPYWSVAPLLILPYFACLTKSAPANPIRLVAAFAVVFAWGFRLTYNWARRWDGLGHEDFRYVDLRKKHGRRYWLVSFFGIHFFPTVLVFLGCLPLYYATTSARPFGFLDFLGSAVALTATFVEAEADEELRDFVAKKPDPSAVLATGLWHFSRHPNYFGEILFWFGVLLLGAGSDFAAAWTSVGALAITALFKFVSVPLMDARMLERRPDYASHMKTTNAIFPWPPRRDT